MGKRSSALKKVDFEHVSCGVCLSDKSSLFAAGKDFEYHSTDDEFELRECKECTNIYLEPRPASNSLSIIYPKNYYAYDYEANVHPIARWVKNILDKRKMYSLLKGSAKGLTYLDVGCGNGRYLEVLHNAGAEKKNLYGIELDKKVVEQLKNKGYHALFGRAEVVCKKLPAKSFDLITLFQVIEHVSEPLRTIQSLKKLLKPGGLLVIETPNTASIDAKIFRRRYWGGYHFPRHWNLMNPKSVHYLLERCNLKVESTRYLPAHSFWIFSFHHWFEEKWKARQLAKFFNPFQNLLLLSLATAFDMVRAKLGFKTSNMQVIARVE